MASHLETEIKDVIIPFLNEHITGRQADDWTSNPKALDDLLTGRRTRLVLVSPQALEYAWKEVQLQLGVSHSINVYCTTSFIDEMKDSSGARRERFDLWYNHIVQSKFDILRNSDTFYDRFRISLNDVADQDSYYIQAILDGNGRVWPVGVIGIYGNSINSWAKRVGLRLTQGKHSRPSTHYMSKRIGQYTFFNYLAANRFLPEALRADGAPYSVKR